MSKYNFLVHFFFLISLSFHQFSDAEVASASVYNPPYTPNMCYGYSTLKLPKNNLFAAAGEGIWDNGAACGRQYLVRCISTGAVMPNPCIPGQETIEVTIIDRTETSVSRPARVGVAIVLSNISFGTIAKPLANSIIIVDIQPQLKN